MGLEKCDTKDADGADTFYWQFSVSSDAKAGDIINLPMANQNDQAATFNFVIVDKAAVEALE